MQYEDSNLDWLHRRKITDETLRQFEIDYSDSITIPVRDEHGNFLFNKHRRNPFSQDGGPKYWYDKGCKTALYGLHLAKDKPVIVITEGELDSLVLWSHNIPAVSSTGGALSFQEKWKPYFENKEVYICLDNDHAGASGMVKTLQSIPHAKIVFLPEISGIKDVSDYYERGGDFRALMSTAKHYLTEDAVREDMAIRKGAWLSTLFHEEWLKAYDNNIRKEQSKLKKVASNNKIEQARKVPIELLIKVANKKAVCLWHNEGTASLHIFADNHAYCFGCGKRADAIDVMMLRDSLSFKEAVERLNEMA